MHVVLCNTICSALTVFNHLVPLQNKIGSGKLMGPKGVSVDRNGHIIVVDNKSCCIFIFQVNGKLVTKFGNRGNGDRQFAGTLNGNMCTAAYSLSPTASHLHVERRRRSGTIKIP